MHRPTLKAPADGGDHPMIGLCEEVLRRARARGSKPDEASALTDLGRAYLQIGAPVAAIPHLEAALPLYRQIDDSEREGLTLEMLSMCYQAMGDFPLATKLMEQTLAIAERAGNAELCAAYHTSLGKLYIQQRQQTRAAACFERSIALATPLHLTYCLAPAELCLAETYTDRARPKDSIPHYQRAIAHFTTLGAMIQVQIARARMGMDMILAAQEDQIRSQPKEVAGAARPRRANLGQGDGLSIMIEAAKELSQQQQWLYATPLLDNIGQLLANRGEHGQAVPWYTRALEALQQCDGALPQPTQGMLLFRLAMASYQSGDPSQLPGARAAYAKALPVLKQEGALREHAICEGNLGTIYMTGGQREQALKLMHSAAATAAKVGDDQLLGQSLANLGLCYFHGGRKAEALPFLQQAVGWLRRAGDAYVLGLVLQALDALRAVQVVPETPPDPPHAVN